MADPVYLTAQEAAAELNVSPATLYAYVSRGMIRSESVGQRRRKRYHAEDVRALMHRRAHRQDNRQAVATSLDFGAPVLDSAITLIGDGGFYYRGRNAVQLASTAGLEQIATLIWDCADRDPFAEPLPAAVTERLSEIRPILRALTPASRMAAALALVADFDRQVESRSGPLAPVVAARIVRCLGLVGADRADADGMAIHTLLAEGFDCPAAADLVRIALVLMADHEFNASTFTVRIAASTRANLYQAVIAGLAALAGARHGGLVDRVTAMLDEMLGAPDPADRVISRLRRGDSLPGFGHPLYPNGDPRAVALLAALERDQGDNPTVRQGLALTEAAMEVSGLAPNIDFANALMTTALGLPLGAAFTVFAVGRSVGWVGHALEQYATRRLIRPRARYIGEPPDGAVRGE